MINKAMRQFPLIYSALGRYVIGWGAHTTVGDECKKARIKKALIVTTGLRGTGIIDEIKEILEYHGVATEVYDKVTTNPKDHEVMAGYETFKAAECDGVVTVGGGSSHNAGVAIRVVASNDGKHITEFATGLVGPPKQKENPKPVIFPQISVNTTAGTGAETGGCFITNTKLRAKQGCGFTAAGAAPTFAIIDPLLIRLMPQHIAAWTGWDAFSHMFESFLSAVQVPHTLGLCIRGIQLFAQNIREFTYNRMNHVACENMCYAESIGGFTMAFGGGGGIVHGIGHHVSAVTNSHHGRTNAVLTPIMERYNEPACPERFAEMARAMGVDTRGMTKMQAADKWFDEVERLLADLNIKVGHLNEQFGLKREDLEHIIDICASEVPPGLGNERPFNREEWLKLLESAF